MVLSLAMGWRHLLFANWPVDPEVLSARVPDAFDVDTYDGRGWLTVVPFTNVAVRPRGLPATAGVRLPELNLRTYVTCDGPDGDVRSTRPEGRTAPGDRDPGVYFFSLDAQGVLGVLGGRLFHHLPYYYARVRLYRDGDGVGFESRRRHPGERPARYRATYRPSGEPFTPAEGSLAAFLVNRGRFYTEGPDGTVRYTDVEHSPWTLRPATADERENTLFAAGGFAYPESDPVLYYSSGVDVVTSRNRRLRR